MEWIVTCFSVVCVVNAWFSGAVSTCHGTPMPCASHKV